MVLVDRPIPDALGYYRAALAYRHEAPDPRRAAALHALVRHHSGHYDLIFRALLDPTIPLGTNKARDPNSQFRTLADRCVADVIHDLDLPHDLLPADGHDQAVAQATQFITTRLATQAAR